MSIHFSEDDWSRIENHWESFWAGKLGRPIIWMEYYDPSVPKANDYRYFFPNNPTALSAKEI